MQPKEKTKKIKVIEIKDLRLAVKRLIDDLPKLNSIGKITATKVFNLSTGDKIDNKVANYLNGILRDLIVDIDRNDFASGDEGDEAYLEALAGRVKEWWANVAIGLEETPAQNYPDSGYFDALEKFMFMQAVYDLISGKLHRLDPVIGDMGCQWRVPFVLDAQEALLREIIDECDRLAIEEDEEKREELDPEVLITTAVFQYDVMIDTLRDVPRLYNLLDIANVVDEYTNARGKTGKPAVLARNHAALRSFFKHTKYTAPEFQRIYKIAKKFFPTWERKKFTTYNAEKYLTVCRLVAARTKRKIDCFGLSAGADQGGLPGTKSNSIAWYQQLAQCSMEYMNHVASEVCKHANITFEEVYEDVDQDIPEYIYFDDDGIDCGNTLVASLHGSLQFPYTTSQNSASYNTHFFFGPLRLIFMYQHAKGQPIIIDHRRIKCTPTGETITYDWKHREQVRVENPKKPGKYTNKTVTTEKQDTYEDATYELIGSEILYFEPAPNGGFVYVSNPTSEQMKKVGMCVETYSTVVVGDTTVYAECDQPFLSTDWDTYSNALKNSPIINLIMMAAADHPELPTNISLYGDKVEDDARLNEAMFCYNACTQEDCLDPSAYMQTIMGKSVPMTNCLTSEWSIVAEKEAALGLLENSNVTITKHQTGLKNKRRCRTISPMPFGAIHIYGCTYAVKVEEMNAALDNPDMVQARVGDIHSVLKNDEIIYRPY